MTIEAMKQALEALEDAMSMLGSRLIKDTFGYEWHEKATNTITTLRAAITQAEQARWYSVTNDGRATLCVDQADAIETSRQGELAWPRFGPYLATRLVAIDSAAQGEGV